MGFLRSRQRFCAKVSWLHARILGATARSREVPMTRLRGASFCVLFTCVVALISCQGVAQKGTVLREGKIRVVKLTIPEWENDGTGARVRETLLGVEGVLNISEIPHIGQVTVTYDQSKVTFEQMEKALNEKGVTVTQRNWLE